MLYRRSSAVILVALSLLLTWIKPFYGSNLSLGSSLALQVLLPGYLLARVLGLLKKQHPIVLFVWILACGLGLTITLGSVLRYLNTPIPTYLLILHGVMLALAPLRPRSSADTLEWRFERQHLPLYLLVSVCCSLMLWTGIQRTIIHFDMEVPTVYTAEVTWLSADAAHFNTPARWSGMSKFQRDSRDRFDGWTYAEAAWSWASGIPPAELVWHGVTALFIWTLPLIAFATAYILSRREDVAAWSAAAFTIFALFTIDSLVYPGNENSLYYGAMTVYMDTVRAASTALILPLAIFSLLTYLQRPGWRRLIPFLLLGHVLAFMRVRQIFVLEFISVAILGAWLLASLSRARLRRALPLLIVLITFTLLPFQMYVQPALGGDVYLSKTIEVTTDPVALVANATSDRVYILEGIFFRILHHVPLLGDTFIIDPQSWFYSPFIPLALILGLAAGWRWRRSLLALYIFATTLSISLIPFVPGIAGLLTRVFGSAAAVNLIAGLNFVLPVPFVLGGTAAWLIDRIPRGQTIGLRVWVTNICAVALSVVLVLLVFEPIPLLYASPHDQIAAVNAGQAGREITAFDQRLLADAAPIFDTPERADVLAVSRTAGFLVEVFPNVFVPGWNSPPRVISATERLYDPATPFVDAADLQFVNDYGFTFVVSTADDLIVTEMTLQPERYQRVLTSSGFVIFRVLDAAQVAPEDQWFSQMNDLYATLDQPRWESGTISLARLADATHWTSIAAAWRERLAEQGSDLDRFGLAMTELLAGNDVAALPLWEALDAAHPEIEMFSEAVAYTRYQQGNTENALKPLLDDLDASEAEVRVLAARTLLTETFFYLLDDAQIDRIVDVTRQDALAWHQLAEWDQANAVRQRAALLMSVQRWDAADMWLSNLLPIEVSPRDLTTRAAIHLMGGDADGALALLQPATDADWIAPRHYLHPDRWTPENNIAAQTYVLLRAALADASDELSLLALTESGAGMVMQPQVEQDANRLMVTATFGSFVPAYLPQKWRVLVVSPDASILYGETEVPAHISDALMFSRGALVVELADDLPELTPAHVIIQSLYSDALVYDTATVNTVLNRPASAQMPTEAETTSFRFGDHIALAGYTVSVADGMLDLSLYWQTDAPLPEDYQVFIHVLDADGMVVAQQDAAPVDSRYPTSVWFPDRLIADEHKLPLDLLAGDYQVTIGFYRLSDLARLPVTPVTERTVDDTVTLYDFTLSDGDAY